MLVVLVEVLPEDNEKILDEDVSYLLKEIAVDHTVVIRSLVGGMVVLLDVLVVIVLKLL